MASNLHDKVIGMAQQLISSPGENSQKLYNMLRLLAKYRSQLIVNTIVQEHGFIVQSGPFKGMELYKDVSEGCFAPKLLGCYEQELHHVINSIVKTGYKNVVNIGCAEGYYAVGLARLLPKDIKTYAYDINPEARRICKEVATINGVENRIEIAGEFGPEDFEAFTEEKSLLICDIEGAELELLHPAVTPALTKVDILVELHDVFNSDISKIIMERFKPSHSIEYIEMGNRDINEFPDLHAFEHLDQLLAFWEWRTGPTPWAYMTVGA